MKEKAEKNEIVIEGYSSKDGRIQKSVKAIEEQNIDQGVWEDKAAQDESEKNENKSNTFKEVLWLMFYIPLVMTVVGWLILQRMDIHPFQKYQTKSIVIASLIVYVLIPGLFLVSFFYADPSVKILNFRDGQLVDLNNCALELRVSPQTAVITINDRYIGATQNGNYTYSCAKERIYHVNGIQMDKYFTPGANVIKVEVSNFGKKKTSIYNIEAR